jgi:Tol biopolymer transport system component
MRANGAHVSRRLGAHTCAGLLLSVAVIGLVAAPGAAADAASIAPGEPWIVYQRFEGGGLHLRMIRPDGSGDHALVPDVQGAQVHPDWSPDGSQVVFALEDRGQLWIVDVDGTDARMVAECVEPCVLIDSPAWSPDGTSIAYMRILTPDGAPASTPIDVLDLDSGAMRTVFTPTPAEEASWWLRWSPDGDELVVSIEHYAAPDSDTIDSSVVAVVDVDDPEEPPLILTEPSMFASYPDWSPDGERIVFTTYDLGFRDFGNYADRMPPSNLYTVAPDGSDLRQVTFYEAGPAPVRNGTASGDLAAQPSWTPDGSRIIFVNVTGDEWPGWGMATIAPDGSGFAPAVGDAFHVGTHPRLRPVR